MKKTKRKGKEKKKTNRVAKDANYGKIDLPKRSHLNREKADLIHSNPYQVSESIVKTIIDKIITLSVRESYIQSLNKVFDNYYCDYLLTQLNSLFATNYLFYYDEPETDTRQNIFWNKSFNKTNTWIEITEPNSSKIDRYENVFMTYVNYVPPPKQKSAKKKNSINRSNTLKEENLVSQNKNELIDMKIKKNSSKKYSLRLKNVLKKDSKNDLDILEEKSSVSSKDEQTKDKINKKNSKFSNANKHSLNGIRKSIRKSISPPKEQSKNSISKSISPKKDLTNELDNNPLDENIIINKNSKKQPILPLNFIEIPDIEKEFNFDKYSPPEVDSLRKEIEEEKIRKEKEAKKKAIIKKITISNENNDDNKTKIIDSNKLTFDSNGKIINFKPVKIETLSRDFASLKNGIKSLENNVELKKTNTRRKRNKKSKDAPKTQAQKEKEIITKNPEDDPNGINKFNFVKISSDKNEQIIPSGSNFSIMLPNIGVTLKEDDQIKEGTREFGKYFKKYSINDYDKILRDYLPLQNKTMLKNKMGQTTNTINNMNLTSVNKKIPSNNLLNTNMSYKYNSTNSLGNNNTSINNNININLPFTQTQNFNTVTELTNPLMNQQEMIQENDTNTNINNTSFIKTNKSNISFVFTGKNLYSTNKMKNLSNFSETGVIRLNKNLSSTSLKNEIENLKDLNRGSNVNFYPSKNKLKSRNIFVSNYKEFFKNLKGKEIKDSNINIGKNMNELNKKIITNGGWGTQTLQKNNSTGNLLYSKHLTKYQALRELGSNLLNGIKVKMPRERKVDINI